MAMVPCLVIFLRFTMNQGKTLDISFVRTLCSELLLGFSYSQSQKRHNVAKSTLQHLRACLQSHNINTLDEFRVLSDEQVAELIYSDKASIDRSSRAERIAIARDRRTPSNDPDLVQPVDYEALVRKFSDNSALSKEDIYRDHVLEAKAANKKCVCRTTFLRNLRKHIDEHKGPDVYMHREHHLGDELQIDWCGATFPIVIDTKGTIKQCPIIVTAWPCSYYVYAEIMLDMTTAKTIEALRNALIFFECLPNRFVIDNAKTFVIKHQIGREAIFNTSFEYFAKCCSIQIDANNPYHPNEKNCVETSVRLVQDRVLSRMDKKQVRFLDEANRELMEKVKIYINDADFRGGGEEDTRAILFKRHELPAARKIDIALPHYIEHFPYLVVDLNYCVSINDAKYSVPYTYAGKTVCADVCNNLVRIFNQNLKEIACHPLLKPKDESIKTEHMPKSHQIVHERELKYKTPEDILNDAQSISLQLASFCKASLERGSFVERKKGCIAMINQYRRGKIDHAMLDEAISRVLHFKPHASISSYAVDEQVKELQTFAAKHDGRFPVQQELDGINITSETPSSTESFLRGNDDLLKGIPGINLSATSNKVNNKE